MEDLRTMLSLKNKVALVTGGGRGMGASIANRFATAGANVAITYHNTNDGAARVMKNIEACGQSAFAVAAHASEASSIQAAVEKTVAHFGGLDILVNNAGIFIAKPIAELTLEDFQNTIEVNVRAAFVASQAAAAVMKEGGRIISIGSNLAEQVPMQGASLYSLSKAALVGFTKGLARDLGVRGITANVIHPGSTNTDMNPADGPFAEAQRNLMAIPKYGEPQDIASLVAWLASEESQFMTGASLTMDGGTNA